MKREQLKITEMPIYENYVTDAIHYMEIYGAKNDLLNVINERLRYFNEEKLINNCISKRFSLVVDVTLLSDMSVPLAQLIVDDTESAENIFIDALKHIIKDSLPPKTEIPSLSVGSDTKPADLDVSFQLDLSFQLKGIPSILLCNSQFTIKPSISNRLTVFRGIIISITPTLKYKCTGIYACSNSFCHEQNKIHITTSWRNITNRCPFCSSVLSEKPHERDLGDFVKAILILNPVKPFERGMSQASAKFYHGIPVRFYGYDLSSGIRLGEEYDVAGSMREEGLHAYYAQKTTPAAILNSFTWPKIGFIMSLREKTISSPWAFFIALASQLSSDLYPMSSFLNLKRGLLLSIVSIGTSSCPIPVFAVGPESLPAHRLMVNASTLAPRTVLHSSQQPITGKVRRQEESLGGNSMWVDAGSLLLAQGGVCYMGDWARHKHETHSAVLSAIEKKQITINSHKTALSTDMSFPLQSAIWMHSSIKKVDKLRPLIDVFGIPFVVDVDKKDEDQVIDALLKNSYHSSSNNENFGIPNEELKMITRSHKVTLGPKAAQLIQDYFVASRRCRGISNPEECLPIGAIDLLTQMSEAHARLSMRSNVTQEDALAAICVCEEAMSALYGQTFMSAPPPLKISKTNWTHFVSEVDCHMKQYGVWIERFLKDLIGENSSQMTWEE